MCIFAIHLFFCWYNIMKKFSYAVGILITAGSLVTPAALFALTATSTPPFRQGIREERRDLREDIKGKRMEIRDMTRERMEDAKEEMKLRMRALKGTATTTPAVRHEVIDEMRGRMKNIREEAKEKRDELRGEVKTRREEIKLKVAKEVAERVRKHFDKMLKRFDAAIERLEKLADRIESRLDKAAENGRDVAALRVRLDAARAKIAEAQTALDEAVAKFEAVVGSDNPREAFKEVEALMSGVKEKIKAAHADLVDVINSLKGIGNTATTTPGGTATTTPAVLP